MQQSFNVSGMSCGHCASAVQKAVENVDADSRVTVDLASGKVEVQSPQPRERLVEAIEDAGYRVQAA